MRMRKLGGLTAIVALAGALFAAAPAQANLITNGGFEQTQYSAGYYAYPNGTLDGWTYSGSAILNASGGSAWYNGSGPSGFGGDQYMALQGGSSLSQSFNSDGGAFGLSFLDAGRSQFDGYGGNQTFQVWIDGNLIGTFSTVSNSNFVLQMINNIDLTAGNHTLTFLGTDPLGDDETAFLDDINLTEVPEPSTIALFGAALLAFGAFYRRRQQAR